MSGLIFANLTGSLVKPNLLQSGIPVDQVVRDTPFLNWLEKNNRVMPSNGSEPFKFNVITAGSSGATTFNEGDAEGSYTAQTYNQGLVNVVYIRVPIQQSGRVLDTNIHNGFYEDIVAGETALALKDLRKFEEQNFLGATTDIGIDNLVDDVATCHGMNPSSITSWVSYHNSVGGNLTVAILEDTHMNMRSETYGARPDFLLSNPNQIRNYQRLVGAGAGNNLAVVRYDLTSNAPLDVGVQHKGAMFNGMEWLEVLDYTSSEIIMGDKAHLSLIVHRDYQTIPLAQTNDDHPWQVSRASVMVVDRRKSFGKISGLAT